MTITCKQMMSSLDYQSLSNKIRRLSVANEPQDLLIK